MYQNEETLEDDNSLIIKTFDEPEFSQNGLGYEIFEAMTRHHRKIAQYIFDTEEQQTYGELLENCIRVAINLKADNLSEDDVLGLSSRNLKDTCVPYIAALFLGIKVIGFDSSISVDNGVHLIKQVTPNIMFVEETALSKFEEIIQLAELDVKLVVIGEEANGHFLFSDYLEASLEDVENFHPINLKSNKETAAILFSSGTTGLPKGICLSHCGIMTQALFLVYSGMFGNNNRAVAMNCSELYWISSVVLMISSLISGSSRVLMANFNPGRLWEAIEKYKMNLLFLSPFQCVELIKSSKPNGIDTSSLNNLITGGGTLPEKSVYNLRDILPGTFINQVYGQTEVCGPLTMFQTRKIDDQLLLHYKAKSVGRPVPGFWYKVINVDDGKILGPNERGELHIKSKCVMNGYYRRDSVEAFDDYGWLRTGDIVYYDEYQCFYVVDRLKEMLKFRGWHIQPALLESILMSHSAVEKAVVIGIPHEEDGEHPMGLVILSDDQQEIDPEELELFVEEQVEDRQRLRAGVKIIDFIPNTNTGKIKRQALRDAVINGEI